MECYIDDLTIYYEDFGEGVPILCLHGFPEDHNAMLGCIEPVTKNLKGFRRIYIDLPGMGKTVGRDWVANADDMVDVLVAFIKKVIGEQSFLLVGLSYGGYLSLGLMLKEKLEIKGLFLICPCTVSDAKQRKLPQKVITKATEVLRINNKQDYEDFLEYTFVVNQRTWERYQNEVLIGLKCADGDFIEKYKSNGYGIIAESQFKEIETDIPVTVITGKKDSCVGFEDSWKTLKHIPQIEFITVDDAGHNLQIEKEEIFNITFEKWLKNYR